VKTVATTKTAKIELRVTPAEKEKLKENAERAKMTMSRYILKLADEKPIIVVEEFPKALKEIRSIGVNINQIARIANSNNYISKKQIEEYDGQYGKLLKLLKDILQVIVKLRGN
jgi:hypothetical protein